MKNIKKITMIFIIIAAITFSYNSRYDSLINEFEKTAQSKQYTFEEYIRISDNFINFTTLYGNDYLKQGRGSDSELYSSLKYNRDTNNYNLDAIGGTQYEKISGNLTGLGTIPEDGVNKDEINLALQFNIFFNDFYTKFPGIGWIYYTSDNNFINIYPWTESKKNSFTQDIKSREFYVYANPEYNPLRKAVWTPIYLDHYGKGLMVTLSSPIYDKDIFKGVVSIDFTTKALSEAIDSKYQGFLIDDTYSAVEIGKGIETTDQVVKLDTLMNIPKSDMKKLMDIPNSSMKRVGKYYVYYSRFNNTDLSMLEFIPVSLIVGKSLLFTIPVLIICGILFFAFSEVKTRKKAQNVLRSIAVTDQLTGLRNRRSFDENALIEINRSDRYSRPLSMIIFDLDFFKHINDKWGHPIGDEVLKQTAEITSGLLRKTDMIFRIGGEEFIVLLPETNLSGAEIVAQKLCDGLNKNKNPIIGNFTASFGVAERMKYEAVESWYKKVDKALYCAKSEGRNRVVSCLES